MRDPRGHRDHDAGDHRIAGPCCGILLALAGCVSSSGAGAQAAAELPPITPNRPTFSDGTSLVPVGHAQLETGYTFTLRQQDGVDTERHNVPEVIARYRLSEAVEARLLWGGHAWCAVDAGTGTVHDDGPTDPAFAIVVPLAAQQDCLPAIALEAATTLGVGDTAFSSGHADPTAKVLWSYGSGPFPDWFGIGGNFNASYPTEGGDRFTQTAASLYATANSGPDTSWFLEWYLVNRPANHVEATQSVDFGVVQRLGPAIAVDARVGFGLDERADDFFSGFGISVLF